MWARDLSENGFPDAIEHVHSVDGACWTEPERLSLPLPGPSWPPIRIAADPAGGLHLLFSHSRDDWMSSTRYLRYGHWNGEEWSALEPILGADQVREMDVVQDDEGTVHLTFVGWDNDTQPTRLFLAEGSPPAP